MSLGAQTAVTPLMLAHFNQLSLIGVVANLLVVPLAAVATTFGMLALLVELASSAVAARLFDALCSCIRRAARGRLRGGRAPRRHGPPARAVRGGRRRRVRRAPPRPAWPRLIVSARWSASWPCWSPRSRSGRPRPTETMLRVTFLNVGQGDAALIELPEGPRLLGTAAPAGPAASTWASACSRPSSGTGRSPASTRWRLPTGTAITRRAGRRPHPLPRGRVLGERPGPPSGAPRRRSPRCSRAHARPPRHLLRARSQAHGWSVR